MPTGHIIVRALIKLLPTAESGRTVPIRGSYRPNHNFGFDDGGMAVGLINFAEGESLKPGEEQILDVHFLSWPDGLKFTPGREWRIQDGASLMGYGKIISVT